jgi:predicted RNase H-like HicB family nuclease
MKYKFKIVLTPIQEPGCEGQYTVTVPSLPGIVTQGSNKEDALKMAEEAISLHIEGMLAENEIIPVDFVETIDLEIKVDK